MRGFRFLGRVAQVSARDYSEDDMLFFSPSEDGVNMREGGIRARNFDLFGCQTAIALGTVSTDVMFAFMFVATALGEDCFA